jgi:DUF4097 and DUF4098 domain-containing protein YvlB
MLRIKRKSTVALLKNGGTRKSDEVELSGFRVTGQVEITLKPSWKVKGEYEMTFKSGK